MFEHIRKEGSFILTSGRRSKYFYDFHLLKTLEWHQAIEALVRKVNTDYDVVVAPATGGIIPAFLFSMYDSNLSMLIVEKNGEVKGPKINGKKFLIVDDVITTLRTVRQSAIQVLIENPTATLVGAAALIYRGTDEDLKGSDIPFSYLERKEIEE